MLKKTKEIIGKSVNFKPQIDKLCNNVKIKLGYASKLFKNCNQGIIVNDFVYFTHYHLRVAYLYTHSLNEASIMQLRGIIKRLACIVGVSSSELFSIVETRVNVSAKSLYDQMTKIQDHTLNCLKIHAPCENKTKQSLLNTNILPRAINLRQNKCFNTNMWNLW
ncbi:Uncharacterised protein r2_g2997 [Pycnogonum litorale]